ncbi:MAG: AzlD domain-containing protein [Haloechinothrix sp.]
MTLAAVVVLAVGTYAFRISGPLLRDRLQLSERANALLARSATVLLVALIATAALTDGGRFAGWALPAGVAVGGALAWRKVPFVLVVVAAAACTAGLRLLGVP